MFQFSSFTLLEKTNIFLVYLIPIESDQPPVPFGNYSLLGTLSLFLLLIHILITCCRRKKMIILNQGSFITFHLRPTLISEVSEFLSLVSLKHHDKSHQTQT